MYCCDLDEERLNGSRRCDRQSRLYEHITLIWIQCSKFGDMLDKLYSGRLLNHVDGLRMNGVMTVRRDASLDRLWLPSYLRMIREESRGMMQMAVRIRRSRIVNPVRIISRGETSPFTIEHFKKLTNRNTIK